MEDSPQTEKTIQEPRSDSTEPKPEAQKPSATLPLMITLIGIFCYLGVVLPSVFKSSTGFITYTIFDIFLMVGGAVLVGLGAYFWFKARTKVLRSEDKKSPDLA